MGISVTRGLAELKMLDKRIQKLTTQIDLIKVGFAYPQNEDIVKEHKGMEMKIKSDFQSLLDLIARRDIIKKAIINSNSITIVRINNKEMTVAEAIERKSSINYKKELVMKMKRSLNEATNGLEQKERECSQRLDAFIASQEKVLKDPTILKSATESFMQIHKPALIDPLRLGECIVKLEEEVENFLTEVDFALSESNARTEIEV